MELQPILFQSKEGKGVTLPRHQVQPGEAIDEAWVQQFIFSRPEVLPVTTFDDAFQNAVAVGREVETDAGFIDVLLLSPQGKIIIVETKLWKNPDKHRTVIAQVIDYAKELSSWTYDRLEVAVNKSLREYGSGLVSIDAVMAKPLQRVGISHEEFQEQLISSMQSGEFLLLIVGDRISPNLALLSNSIAGAPGLNFRLGLIEMKMFRLDAAMDWPLLVIPDVVGRTVEAVRGVIRIQYQKEQPQVEVLAEEGKENAVRSKTNRALFLAQTRSDLRPVFERWLDRWEEQWSCNWGVKGFSLRIPIGDTVSSVLYAYPDWAVSIIWEEDLLQYGMKPELYQAYREKVTEVSAANQILAAHKRYVNLKDLSDTELDLIFEATNELFSITMKVNHE